MCEEVSSYFEMHRSCAFVLNFDFLQSKKMDTMIHFWLIFFLI